MLSTWQLIRLSQQCSSSPVHLIVYRRFKRFFVDQWGSFLWSVFGYRKNISYESILKKAGCSNEELEHYVQVLLSSIANCWNSDKKLTQSGRNLIEVFFPFSISNKHCLIAVKRPTTHRFYKQEKPLKKRPRNTRE